MAKLVCSGALLQCSFGAAPSNYQVVPANRVTTSNMAAATIMDNITMGNIQPFGMCSSLANPQVAAATTAAPGVLTPQPCLPVIPAPWIVGSPTVLIGNKPALNDTSTLMCAWAGVIQIKMPGQMTVDVP
jgi:hypothetical protein